MCFFKYKFITKLCMGPFSSPMLMYMKKKVSAITLAKAHLQKKNKMTSHLFLLLYQAQSYTCGGWIFNRILAIFNYLDISIFNAVISICLMFLLFCHYNPIRSDSHCHYGPLWSHFDCLWRMAIMLNSSVFESCHHPRFKILLIIRSSIHRLLSESKKWDGLSRVQLSS